MSTNTNTQHTPGPWRIAMSADGSKAEIQHSDGELLSKVADLNQNWICDEHGGTVDANALLLAAAPELLAALELIVIDKDGDGFICREGMDQVRAAIAKAKGGAA